MTLVCAARPPDPQQAADPWRTHTVVIRSIRPEVGGVSTYELAFRDAVARAQYRFAPGQFNMLYVPGAGEIAISISDDPQNLDSCAHTIRAAGNVTRTLANMKTGETLGLRGPFGTGWPMAECIGRDVVLVAGGIGLAPLRPVILSMLHDRRKFGRLSLLYGARSPEMLLYEDQFEPWSRQGWNVHTTVDRSRIAWRGNVGVVTLLLERLKTFDPRNAVLMCCGPEVMMRFTAMAARNRGMASDQIWLSIERNMQCAVGLCGHCQLASEFVCKDGPIFRLDRIAHWLDVEGL